MCSAIPQPVKRVPGLSKPYSGLFHPRFTTTQATIASKLVVGECCHNPHREVPDLIGFLLSLAVSPQTATLDDSNANTAHGLTRSSVRTTK
jgi:hypothetical protein